MDDNALTYFQILPDFNAQSANGCTCYISNLGKQKPGLNKQPHEIDEFILRGPEIDFEGYMDIRPEVVLTTARELGMVPGDEHEDLQAQLADLQDRHDQLQDVHDALVKQYDQVMAVIADAEAFSTPDEEVLTDPADLEELIDNAKR